MVFPRSLKVQGGCAHHKNLLKKNQGYKASPKIASIVQCGNILLLIKKSNFLICTFMDIVGLSFVVFYDYHGFSVFVVVVCPLKYILNVSKQGFFGDGIQFFNNK
jgi:hypothetical protein